MALVWFQNFDCNLLIGSSAGGLDNESTAALAQYFRVTNLVILREISVYFDIILDI